MSLSDAAVLRSIVRGRLLSPDQLWSALEQTEAKPLADVLRDRGLLDEQKILSFMTDTLADGRVAVAADSDATVRKNSSPTVPSIDRSAAPKGNLFGKFVLQQKLGEGGMGEVWKALQVDLGRTVAVKMVLRVSDEDLARFRREAQLAASLAHPNIIQVYEVGEVAGRPYLAMQFIEGHTLTGQRLPVRRVLEIVRDASEAVHHAHLRGIVHRDIKPHNIMVDGAGKVFVMDFGLARQAQQPGEGGLTVSGEVLGTPGYMAPEQTRALNHLVAPPTDVWALGVTLYELVTASKPFEGAGIGELFSRIQSADPVPPHKLVPRLDRDVETIILKCLDKDPARRYQTAGELAADLARAHRGDAILARRPGFRERWARRLLRNQGVVTAVALLLLAAVPAAIVLGTRDAAGDLQSQLAAAQRSGDFERAAALSGRMGQTDDEKLKAAKMAVDARDAAELRADHVDVAELLAAGDELAPRSRDHAIAAYAMAVGIDTSSRAARSKLAALLGDGPAARRLDGPGLGEARLDLTTDPPDAKVVYSPKGLPPFFKPDVVRVTVSAPGRPEALWSARLYEGMTLSVHVKLPAAAHEGFLFLADGRGGGFFIQKKLNPPATWTDADAAAKAAGGRLPTLAEAQRWRGTRDTGRQWTSTPNLTDEFNAKPKPATDKVAWLVVKDE